jgi:hypothetical protein
MSGVLSTDWLSVARLTGARPATPPRGASRARPAGGVAPAFARATLHLGCPVTVCLFHGRLVETSPREMWKDGTRVGERQVRDGAC